MQLDCCAAGEVPDLAPVGDGQFSSRMSPEGADVVFCDLGIASHEHEVLDPSLRNQKSVEGIAMLQRKQRKFRKVSSRDR